MPKNPQSRPAPDAPARDAGVISDLTDRRLRDLLISRGLLTSDLESNALVAQNRDGLTLADALVKVGAVPRGEVLAALGEIHAVPSVDLDRTFGDPLILYILPKDKAHQLEALPLFLVERQLTIAVADPDNLKKLDDLRFITNKEILPVVTLSQDIRRHLVEYYGDRGTPPDSDKSIALEFDAPSPEAEGRDLLTEAVDNEGPVVRLLNLMLIRALEVGASDIHIEPRDGQTVVRYRIDGRLHVKPFSISGKVHASIVSRIKILSRLDIAERRLPQDGKLKLKYSGRPIDVRVSTFPTIHDEKVVLRILDKEQMDFRLENIGMSDPVLRTWRDAIRAHEGLILVTGPTSSGKSSTLFATLRHLDVPEVNIVTLEDPVEYQLDGITQGQVHERIGFTFAKGLRAILRQDPEVILVGEIRDAETADIAVQSALTGHLVLASLHTNDAPSAVTRLANIGVAPYLLSSSLVTILAQRLVRRLCPDCVADASPTADEREFLGRWLDEPGMPFRDGSGCPACLGSGYRGRTAVHEILAISPRVRGLIARGATAAELADAAREEGYRSLWADGLEKVRAGVTSLRELARVVGQDPS
jgi:type IV pilus assembly protein PilB